MPQVLASSDSKNINQMSTRVKELSDMQYDQGKMLVTLKDIYEKELEQARLAT